MEAMQKKLDAKDLTFSEMEKTHERSAVSSIRSLTLRHGIHDDTVSLTHQLVLSAHQLVPSVHQLVPSAHQLVPSIY